IHEINIDIHLTELAAAFEALSRHKLQDTGIAVLEVDPAAFVNQRNTGKGVFTFQLKHTVIGPRHFGQWQANIKNKRIGITTSKTMVIPIHRTRDFAVVAYRVAVQLTGNDTYKSSKFSNARFCAEIEEIEGFCFFDLHKLKCLIQIKPHPLTTLCQQEITKSGNFFAHQGGQCGFVMLNEFSDVCLNHLPKLRR